MCTDLVQWVQIWFDEYKFGAEGMNLVFVGKNLVAKGIFLVAMWSNLVFVGKKLVFVCTNLVAKGIFSVAK